MNGSIIIENHTADINGFGSRCGPLDFCQEQSAERVALGTISQSFSRIQTPKNNFGWNYRRRKLTSYLAVNFIRI